MRSFAWALAWLNQLSAATSPFVLIARKAGKVEGILPLARESTLLRGRRLLLVGSGKACGDDLGLLASKGSETVIAEAMLAWLRNAKGKDSWDQIDLDGVQPSTASTSALLKAFESADFVEFLRRTSESCWSLKLASDANALLNDASKRTRRMLRQIDDAYIKSGRAVLQVAASYADAKEKIAKIAELHQSRWKDRKIVGCFGTDGFGSFIDELLLRWWESRTAYVATLNIDGLPRAGGIGFWRQDELAIYLIGMDIDAEEHRPGWLFNIESIRLAHSAGKSRLNFLRGDEEYKQRLGATPTVQERWIATSQRTIPQLRKNAIQQGIEVRNWFRRRKSSVSNVLSTT